METTSRHLPVPDGLRRWVDGIRCATLDADRDQSTLIHVPDPASALVWRTTSDGRADLIVLGPRTRASYTAGKGIPLCITLRIRPGCTRALLGVSAEEIIDQAVPLSDLRGEPGKRIADELSAASTDPCLAMRRIEAALLEHLSPDAPRDTPLIGEAAAALSAASTRPVRVRAVASQLGISERHLRNRFTSAVGVAPKHFARIARVRATVSKLGEQPWAQLAAATGYCDQSHMIAEFRALMHVAPGAFAAGRLPACSRC